VAVLPVLQSVVWNLMPATTVGRAVNAATQRLEEAGVSTARLDAQVILAHVLGVGRSWLFAHFEYALDDAQANEFTELIARRVKHEPVAYLIGRKEFYGIELQVDRRVLIPRPETEMLVDAALVLAANQSPAPISVADVGTGSGAIALAVAANAENARIYAMDVSRDALAVAASNTARLDSRGQVTLLHGDLLESLPEAVDVIVANLPYVTRADFRTLDADIRNYEPQLALEAGERGLDIIARLLQQVPSRLCPGGSVILEIGYNQGQAVLDLLADILPQALHADVHKDYQGRDRMVTFSL
jgi:release factor glutamine methyltransferase